MEAEPPRYSGMIQSIVLKNFMCHDNLVVDLKSGINVIHGPNGSGKSAILTGLMFVFGTRAAITNRASSFKDFIKLNRQSASVAVTLCNLGLDPFHPSKFGSRIVIHRKVNKSGVTAYKILNDNNEVVGKTKDCVFSIIEHFGIHVDNPINVLNQESSKTFLTTSNPKVKYKLFMRATNLQDMVDHYEESKLRQAKIQKNLDNKMDSIVVLKDHMDSLGAKIEILKELENIGNKIKSLQNKLTSRYIMDLQQKSQENELFVCNNTKILHEKRSVAESMSISSQQKRRKLDILNQKTSFFIEKMTDLSDKHEKAAQEKLNLLNKIDVKVKRLTKHNSELNNTKILYNDCLKVIESRTGFEQDIESKRTELNQSLTEITARINASETELESYKKNLSQVDAEIINLNAEIEGMNKQISRNEHSISEKKRKIDWYRSNELNKLAIYGDFTINVQKIINSPENEQLFERKPIGPIGSFISVKNAKWHLPVELCLKNLLSSYIVFSYKDKEALLSIFQKVCPRQIPPVVIFSYRDTKYDTRERSPSTSYPTVLDLIECSDVNIINLFIDLLSIESILCIENSKDARDVMIPTPPKNVIKAYTADGDEIISSKNYFRFYSATQKFSKFLSQDNKQTIKELTNECNVIAEEIQKIKDQIISLSKQSTKHQSNLSGISIKIDNLEKQILTFNKKSQQIKKELESINLVDVIELQKEAEDYKNHLEKLKAENLEYSNEIEELKKNLVIFDTQLEDFQKECSTTQQEHEIIEKKCKLKLRKLTQMENQLKIINKEISAIELQIKQKLDKESFVKEQIEIKTHLLTEEGLVQVDLTVTELENELKKLNYALKNFSMSPEEAVRIKNEYQTVVETYTTHEGKVKDLMKFNTRLKKMIKKRLTFFIRIREVLSKNTKMRFQALLRSRAYDGSLEFDHENEKLLLKVNPNTSDGLTLGDSKCLSGGERSFSTLSLIVSLWEIIESPFRCLDEFDVFMDVVNRRIGLRLLCDFSTDHPEQQIILITPQDIGHIYNKHMNIYMLDNPR